MRQKFHFWKLQISKIRKEREFSGIYVFSHIFTVIRKWQQSKCPWQMRRWLKDGIDTPWNIIQSWKERTVWHRLQSGWVLKTCHVQPYSHKMTDELWIHFPEGPRRVKIMETKSGIMASKLRERKSQVHQYNFERRILGRKGGGAAVTVE